MAPKIAVIWPGKRIMRAAMPQVSPKASTKNGTRVPMLMPLRVVAGVRTDPKLVLCRVTSGVPMMGSYRGSDANG
jgi:hypothetical protein